MNFTLPLLMTLLPAAVIAQSQSGATSGMTNPPVPKTTEVLVIETPKQGVTFQQIIAVMPDEVRATAQLYLDGKIRQWYSRGDGRGVVFIIDATSEDEAKAIVESLPLSKQQLLDHQYVALGPFMPLRMLIGPAAQR
ncbi:conserved hypothetical protein [Candidatus Koribacter versatilis Ellin345]|uniref:Muconolactone isomerase domain-containing protein n=1 Tax=Koribacter versatilis (strain Ellin345) TaxID=204669 RepID=Q1ITU8_KORVE|nr:hypothetical protein [Candidatus Koribacter versatilis]ABF39702.1 conserved hypothetical protein [Candidatus Koribacter versatilis Ellin345]